MGSETGGSAGHAYTGAVTVGGPPDVRNVTGLQITKIAVGPFDNNCYFLRCTATGEVLPAAERLGLHFAEAGLMVWTTRSAEDLEAFGASLVAEVGAIRRREFEPRAGTACRWCEYRTSCPDAGSEASVWVET